MSYRKQQTIGRSVAFSGIGLHLGQTVTLTMHPAPENHGVVFRRADLPGTPKIPATVDYVCETARNTTLGVGEVRIYTVEHVLAAVRGCELDNVLIDIEGKEPPAANGSSDTFVQMIEEAGIEQQTSDVVPLSLSHPVYWSEGEIHLVALPSDSYRVSYTLSYPGSEVLKGQYYSLHVTPEAFKTQISPCRSFGLYHEIGPLMDKGLIKGCSLANSVVIDGKAVFSKGGLFFQDEMVRHKILDLIGDLSLVGMPFVAHIIAIRSGHASHRIFASKLSEALTTESRR